MFPFCEREANRPSAKSPLSHRHVSGDPLLCRKAFGCEDFLLTRALHNVINSLYAATQPDMTLWMVAVALGAFAAIVDARASLRSRKRCQPDRENFVG